MTTNFPPETPVWFTERPHDLPQWGLAAIAARAARRVLPLTSTADPFEPEVGGSDQEVADWGIWLAEESAATAFGYSAGSGRNTDADAYYNYSEHIKRSPAEAAALHAAKEAEGTRVDLQEGSPTGRPELIVTLSRVLDAAERAIEAGRYLDVVRPFRNAVLHDARLLAEFTRVLGWTDKTPVPPALLGPLWPMGRPAEFPAPTFQKYGRDASKPNRRLCIQVAVPEDQDEAEFQERLKDFAVTMSRLHKGFGGSGLRVRELQVWDAAGVPVGVGT